MYIVRIGGFAISMIIELTVAALLLFVCGIAVLLRAIGILFIWPLRKAAYTAPILKRWL